VFQGLGCMKGDYDIKIKSDAKPSIHAPRRVPILLKNSLLKSLNDLEEGVILAKVDEPTDWVSSMVTVVKGDKVRICLDPSDLNQVI